MDEKHEHSELLPTVSIWRQRLEQLGLGAVVDAVLIAMTPIAPIGAQLLYISQPMLTVFVERDSVTRWAKLLEEPNGLNWLRQNLADSPIISEVDNDDE